MCFQMLKGKTILIISPEAWGDIHVSKHHYARELVERGNSVYFLNPPDKKLSVSTSEYSNLNIIDYRGFPRGMRFMPAFLQRMMIFRTYRNLESLVGVSFDLVWSFDISVFYDFNALPSSVLKILHVVDLINDLQVKKAATTADICFGVTEEILLKLRTYNAHAYKIQHGVKLTDNINLLPASLPGSNQLKALFVGNLSLQFLDWDKLNAIAMDHKNVDFIFLGPDGGSNLSAIQTMDPAKEALRARENSYFLSAVPADQIMSYLQTADILLVSLKEKCYRTQTNSHKIMEYLASGKPIVATWTAEYEGSNLLYMAKTMEGYKDMFRWVINNLAEVSGQESVNARRQFALDNTYHKQLERIEDLLEIK
jgi:glycosyltransferase involved in cell wall biosynthesis